MSEDPQDAQKLVEALEEYESALKSASNPVERAQASQGVINRLWRLGRREDAGKILLRRIRELPEDHFVRLDLEFTNACFLWHNKKYKESLRILDDILPKSRAYLDLSEGKELYGDIQVKRGILLKELQRYGEAYPVLEEALSFQLPKQDKADVLFSMAVCDYHLGRKELAKEKFKQALEAGLQEDWAVHGHYYLGLIHFENRAFAWARKEFELCERPPEGANLSRKGVLEMLSHTCRALGLEDEAVRYETLIRKQK